MRTLSDLPPATQTTERGDLDIVASHLRVRRRGNRLMLWVAGVMTVLAATLALHGIDALQPVPDATFAFRV